MDFLLAHHLTKDSVRAEAAEASVERSIEAIHDPGVRVDEKRRFVEKLRVDLEVIRTEKRGHPTDEDVAEVIDKIREAVMKEGKARSAEYMFNWIILSSFVHYLTPQKTYLVRLA